jgi:hypothetical protein
MPKKLIQDMFVKKRGTDFFKKKPSLRVEEETHSKKPPVRSIAPDKHIAFENRVYGEKSISKNSKIFLWIICIISVATLLFLLLSIFSTASITITPKEEMVTLNDTYNIISKKEIDGLHYEVINLKRDLSEPLASDGEKNVERKAVGKAVLYNNFSTANQRLINNTRLESLDGLIYRIRQSVDIPGMETKNGIKIPGSVEVEIIADMPGEKYNMKLTDFKGDFTIPGFKGSTKYDGFYGRLSSDITGGLIGKVKSVSDEKLSAGRAELKNTLSDGLIKDIYLQKPDQYSLFKDNYFIQFTDLPDSSSIDSDYKITEEAVIYAIIFNKDELSAFIAKNKIKNFDGSKVDILWNDNIQSAITGATAKPWQESSLKIKLTGDADVVWSYDKAGILSLIAGKNKSILKNILDENKNSIVEAKVNISPAWKQTLPDNIKKIQLIDSVRDNVTK